MGTRRGFTVICVCFVLLLLSGCVFWPSAAHCKGKVFIESYLAGTDTAQDRIIIVSAWEYPTVNNSTGKLQFDKVFIADKQEFTVSFPLTGYWVAWTPVLATQHLAPEPALLVFRKDSFLSVVHPDNSVFKLCCMEPPTKCDFTIVPGNTEATLDVIQRNLDRQFFAKLALSKGALVKKVNSSKNLTKDDKLMVIEQFNASLRGL